MVSFSIIVLISVIVFFAVAFIYVFFFQRKGRKVIIRLKEELASGHWIHIEPDKAHKGLLYRDHDSVEKLKIPKKFSKYPIEAPNLTSLMPSDKGTYVVDVVKDAEGLYRPVNVEIIDAKTYREKVEQRESMGWYINEKERSDKKYQKNDMWSKYGAVVTIGVIAIAGMMMIYVTGQQINELNDDYRQQTLGEIQEQRSFLLDAVNNIKGETPINEDTSENTDRPPSRG